MNKIKQFFKSIKQWLKSKTLYLNTVVLPVVIYYGDLMATTLNENITFLSGYMGKNVFFVIYILLALYVRAKTTKSIRDK